MPLALFSLMLCGITLQLRHKPLSLERLIIPGLTPVFCCGLMSDQRNIGIDNYFFPYFSESIGIWSALRLRQSTHG